jgi:hypothetical protein
MAREIYVPFGSTGNADLYFRRRNAAGQYWRGDTSVYESYNAANIALYGADAGSGSPYNVLAEDGATGDYFGTDPGTGAGTWTAYEQAGAAPLASDVAVAVGETGIDAIAAAQSQTAAAAAITAAGLATASAVASVKTDTGTTIPGLIAAIDGAGGIYTQTVTVHDSLGADVPNARVEIWSGGVLVSSKVTSALGVATPSCNAGAFTLKVLASGYASYSAALTVTANATVGTIVLTAFSVTPSPAGFVTGYVTCYGYGVVLQGAIVTLELYEGANTDGLSMPTTQRTVTSGADGVASFAGIPWGATVRYQRGTGKWTRATAPTSGTTWAMNEVDGTP